MLLRKFLAIIFNKDPVMDCQVVQLQILEIIPGNGQSSSCSLNQEVMYFTSTGNHYQERATSIQCLCHGVFTDQVIFRHNFPGKVCLIQYGKIFLHVTCGDTDFQLVGQIVISQQMCVKQLLTCTMWLC